MFENIGRAWRGLRRGEVAFRVHPLPDDEFHFLVRILPTLREMRAAMDASGCPRSSEVLACCWSTGDPFANGGQLGVLFFALDRLDAGIVAHEMVHAGFRAAEACGVRVEHWDHDWSVPTADAKTSKANTNEEQYADVVEQLIAQFWREAHAAGVAAEA